MAYFEKLQHGVIMSWRDEVHGFKVALEVMGFKHILKGLFQPQYYSQSDMFSKTKLHQKLQSLLSQLDRKPNVKSFKMLFQCLAKALQRGDLG